MEWIKKILEENIGKDVEDGVLNLEEALKEINQEFPKNAVPKSEFNTKIDDLKKANETIDTLQKENKDVETLQTTINDYKTQIEQLESERAKERKTYAIKEALQGAGAQDVDYMMFKLGELEVDEEGNVRDLENKVKELKESNPTFFATKDDEDTGNDNLGGFQVLDNKLDNGKQPDPAQSIADEFSQALDGI